MENSVSINERINELSKIVYTVEWDIPNIKNKTLRIFKEKRLAEYKMELERLLEKRNRISKLDNHEIKTIDNVNQ